MKTYELDFAKIIVLNENTAEVIINDAVEMNTEMVDQYHEFLLTHLTAPFLLLINKVNHYTYDFQAQCKLATLNEIRAIAVVAYSEVTRVTTESVIEMPRKIEWNVKIFSDRGQALDWLSSNKSDITSAQV